MQFANEWMIMMNNDQWNDVCSQMNVGNHVESFMKLVDLSLRYLANNIDVSTNTIEEIKEQLKKAELENKYFVDNAFTQEYIRAGEQTLKLLYKEVISSHVYSPEEFKAALQSIPAGSSVMVMDHSSSEKYFGIPRSEFICLLEEKKLQEVYLGVCFGADEAEMLHRESPMTTVYSTRAGDIWE